MLQQQNKYLENSIQTSTPAQLVIMLCDGAIRFCKAGAEAIKKKKYAEANRYLIKTQRIINEFIITLDRSLPIADELLRLYDYFNYRLIQANSKKDAEPAEEVLQYLIELKETWTQAAKIVNASGVRHG
ncbi:MAG: flagellar export chaperone FliS [Paenibacillaceae bacterium]|uniref:flagellar export chaperone FliS n=1 Tax=Paenibacillus cymbidii TaxID=1639034 RepID=UPI001081BCE4|nr:flagellar export chaperone FliS [Paenibacillus cymbidii]MBO9607982.1 flagellar export chaperone FliS [Paenibacillaceae bacterium]